MIKNLHLNAGRLAYKLLARPTRYYLKDSRRAYVILVHSEQVLMVKNWFGNQQWRLPGGGLKNGESPKEGLVREVSEELGVQIHPNMLKPVSEGRWNYEKNDFGYHIFLADLPNKPKVKAQKTEIADWQWFEFKSLPENLPPEIIKALSKV